MKISASRPVYPASDSFDASDSLMSLLELVRRTDPAVLLEIMSELKHDVHRAMGPRPRDAYALALVARALAHASEDVRAQADTALLSAQVSNRSGDFVKALALACVAIEQFKWLGILDRAAQARCAVAWANGFIGHLNEALADLESARLENPSLVVYCDWIEGRVRRDQGYYPDAEKLFQRARDAFRTLQQPLYIAHCDLELAHNQLLTDRDPLAPLEQARAVFDAAGLPTDVALCDFYHAQHLNRKDESSQAVQVLLRVQPVFIEHGMGFWAACCDNELGICYRHLDKYADARQVFEHARDYFMAQKIDLEVSTVAINLGNLYYSLNRYDDALVSYGQALDIALRENRFSRTALIYDNMGLAYARQGRHLLALQHHREALRISELHQLPPRSLALRHVNIAEVYRELGDLPNALEHLEQAHKILSDLGHLGLLAECAIDLAELYMFCEEPEQAESLLARALQVCEEQQFNSLVAACLHVQARLALRRNQIPKALALIANARERFLWLGRVIDGAHCTLTLGEAHLQMNDIASAQTHFEEVRKKLSPSFPELVWQGEYGLARCARSAGDGDSALGWFRAARHRIGATHAGLFAGRFSNTYFKMRQAVYDEGLDLALKLGALEDALETIDMSKARTFLALVQARGWKLRAGDRDPRRAQLIAREEELRQDIEEQRERLAGRAPGELLEAWRGGETPDAQRAKLAQQLDDMTREHQAVVEELQQTAPGLARVPAPPPLNLATLRGSATRVLGARWTALSYYVRPNSIIMAVLTPDHLAIQEKPIDPRSRAAIENIARGDINSGDLYRLHALLIPDSIDADTLLISVQGLLHAVPFHALMANGHYLIERHAALYTPNLQVAQILYDAPSKDGPVRVLGCGLGDFGPELHPLPNTLGEIESLARLFPVRFERLWESQATREALLKLDRSGELMGFDVLHFATHAILDARSPYQSRIELYDTALTLADILDLSLNARLVVLAACRTAGVGEGAGDEFVSLARAFFYAGARGLVATLWPVHDRPVVPLMEAFYRSWTGGKNLAQALRQAQMEMIDRHEPAQWAAFKFIGKP